MDYPAFQVTSLAEVWIEICSLSTVANVSYVTSLAEVWIEIVIIFCDVTNFVSLPLRKCGLKFI